MPKRKVLFVAHHLTIGGVQKSLISALNAIDYDQNDVTLYLRKNRVVLLPYVNKNVNVIINDDSHHYYRKAKALWLQCLIIIMSVICNHKAERIKKRLSNTIVKYEMQYEQKHFFEGKSYDIAISYVQGQTALFVSNCITAERKFLFFQGSVDESHEMHKRLFPDYESVVVEHEDIKRLLSLWYPGIDSKIQILQNYTDYLFLREMKKEKTVEVFSDRVTLCTCSRFSPEKGIDLAIEAARIMKSRGHSFLWYILGDGPEMEKIKSLIEQYDLSDCVRLMGMQTNPYPYMAACDIYVQPSREEALSISMLESQILCAPMASTKTAGGLAMIKEGVNGLLADINPESLADIIEELMVNKELRAQIKQHLSSIDYSAEEERYKNDWKKLLGH